MTPPRPGRAISIAADDDGANGPSEEALHVQLSIIYAHSIQPFQPPFQEKAACHPRSFTSRVYPICPLPLRLLWLLVVSLPAMHSDVPQKGLQQTPSCQHIMMERQLKEEGSRSPLASQNALHG